MIFLAIAFGVSWLLKAPLVFGWLDPGPGLAGTDAGPNALAVAAGSMLAPALGVLVVTRWLHRPPSIPLATGLAPLRPHGRLLGYCLLALVLFPALSLLTLLVAAPLGLYHFDLANLSGMRESLGLGPTVPVAGTALLAALLMFLPGLPLMFGEEWGWRGYLEPRLQSLGLLPMVAISGFVWGIWHLPAAFVADRDPLIWVTAYLIDCTLHGALLCWLRLRTRTIWPAVLGHGVISGFPGPVLAIWLSDADRPYDAFAVESLGGWISWILKAALIALLFLAGRFRPVRDHERAP
ncbi:CPBP family intramembrane glutamic endopeptidase [Nonomuraea sp. NPDC050404]|uniref:CPBP family intramembrane glutamic endopeptidase n=1 Tax=Nonomuraea sp. NPDC050404 TaxID=3155783 RepID=UPI0033DB3D6A